jgi:hypothetical protein
MQINILPVSPFNPSHAKETFLGGGRRGVDILFKGARDEKVQHVRCTDLVLLCCVVISAIWSLSLNRSESVSSLWNETFRIQKPKPSSCNQLKVRCVMCPALSAVWHARKAHGSIRYPGLLFGFTPGSPCGPWSAAGVRKFVYSDIFTCLVTCPCERNVEISAISISERERERGNDRPSTEFVPFFSV